MITYTLVLILLVIFLLIAFGGVCGWLLHEIYISPVVDEEWELNNVGNEETK